MKPRSKKTILITVIVAAVFAISGAVALAASNISGLEDLYLAFRTAQVEKAVDNGEMTSDDAQTYLTNLTERMEADETDAVPPLRGTGKGLGMGAPRSNMLELYSEVSGLSIDEIKDACNETSIFAIADEADLLDELKAAMIEDANERIDQFVADGRITEDKATELKANSQEKINSITADTMPPVKEGTRPGMGQGSRGKGGGQCGVTP